MPAGIEVHEDGRATFVAVKQHGWHQLGTLSSVELSVKSAMKKAHLAGLEYHMEPVVVPVGEPAEFTDTNFWASVRRNPFDPDKWDVLGAGMSEQFVLHTPEEAFAFGENIIEQGHPLAALGSINDGKRAFAAFKLEDITIGGTDVVHSFLNVMTAFDGSMATLVRVSTIRVECANTFHAVASESSAPTYRVRHIGEGLERRVDDARAALGIGWKGLEQFQAQAEAMMQREITNTEFDKIVEGLFPIDKDKDSERVQTNRYEMRDKVRAIYEGPTVKGIKGTAWGAFNAATEFADWTSGKYESPESRMVAQITPGSTIDTRRLRAGRVVAKVTGLQLA